MAGNFVRYTVRYVSASGTGETQVQAKNSADARAQVESMYGFGSVRSVSLL